MNECVLFCFDAITNITMPLAVGVNFVIYFDFTWQWTDIGQVSRYLFFFNCLGSFKLKHLDDFEFPFNAQWCSFPELCLLKLGSLWQQHLDNIKRGFTHTSQENSVLSQTSLLIFKSVCFNNKFKWTLWNTVLGVFVPPAFQLQKNANAMNIGASFVIG